jgi:hypothetical protein
MNSVTKKYSDLKPQAIALRLQGKTFSEIQNELGPIPKGTLSGWLKNTELTSEQKERIRKIVIKNGMFGRQMGAWANQQKRLKRLSEIKTQATSEYHLLLENPLFAAGLVLYLAEGSKKSEQFQFMNSDPYLIRLMIQWILLVSNVRFSDLRFRLYIHELYAHENCESFWATALGANTEQFLKTIYKPTSRLHKKNPVYKGCLRIEVSGSDLYWRTMAWRDCLYSSMG